MAFSEALQIAREKDVDFILLGGDLFHVNKPSSSVEHKCIKIIRQHMNTQSDKQTTFERIRGDLCHFERLKHANFEDPNLRVQYPIFTIHGNHDDPTGPNARSVCEKLATCGLINYFGLVRPTPDKEIEVKSIVLKKGAIKIALYGIGFIPDQKLRQAFEKKRVIFEKPAEDTFNILVVHQNRIQFDKNKYIPDSLFPKFFHLIIRGHEHNTQKPEIIPESLVDGLVYQPGSTVATSISTMEAGAKRVGLMSISINNPNGCMKTRYKLDYELVPLKCCRKMIFKDVHQKEIFKHIKQLENRKKVTSVEYRQIFKDYITKYIEKQLKEYEDEFGSNNQVSSEETIIMDDAKNPFSVYDKLHRFKLPLMRIRLEFANKAERFNELEVETIFYPDRVANRDIVLFKKQKIIQNAVGVTENVTFLSDTKDDDDEMDEIEVIDLKGERKDTIDTMIADYFLNKPLAERLQVLSLEEYTQSVKSATEDGNVISKVLNKKKLQVLQKFELALKDEQISEQDFHDENQVQSWMIAAFKKETILKKDGGDVADGDQYSMSLMDVDEDSIIWDD